MKPSCTFSLPSALWIQRQRQHDAPACFICWRPELSQMLQRPADVLAFAAANPQVPAEDHQRLRAWLTAWDCGPEDNPEPAT
jgi:hypothetical protein